MSDKYIYERILLFKKKQRNKFQVKNMHAFLQFKFIYLYIRHTQSHIYIYMFICVYMLAVFDFLHEFKNLNEKTKN